MSVDGQPLVYKLLNKFGAVFFIIVLIFCIAYAILASQQSSNMSNYLRLSSLTSESYGSIA